MVDKLKSFLRSDRTFFSVLLVVVAVTAYGLGLQSGQLQGGSGESTPAIVFTQAPETAVPDASIAVVASKNGSKYHRLDCPGADTIKEANLIRFASEGLARAAGYTPAANCNF